MVVLEGKVQIAVKVAHAAARDDLVSPVAARAAGALATRAAGPAPTARAEALGRVAVVVDADLRDLSAASSAATVGGALRADLHAQAGALGHGAIQARAPPRLALFRCQHGGDACEKGLGHPGDAGERPVQPGTLRGTRAEVEDLSEQLLGGAPLIVHDEGDSPHLLFGEGHIGIRECPGQRDEDLVERVLDHQSTLLLGERGTGQQH